MTSMATYRAIRVSGLLLGIRAISGVRAIGVINVVTVSGLLKWLGSYT